MTRKGFYLLTFGFMVSLIVAANIIGFFFPNIPGYAYWVFSLVAGVGIVRIGKMEIKKSNLVLSDERTHGIFSYAATLAYRVNLAAILLFTVIVNGIPDIRGEWIIAGRTLMVFLLFQMAVFYVAYALRSRKV